MRLGWAFLSWARGCSDERRERERGKARLAFDRYGAIILCSLNNKNHTNHQKAHTTYSSKSRSNDHQRLRNEIEYITSTMQAAKIRNILFFFPLFSFLNKASKPTQPSLSMLTLHFFHPIHGVMYPIQFRDQHPHDRQRRFVTFRSQEMGGQGGGGGW